MSHLIQIAATGEIRTLDYDGTEPSAPQLLRALSTEGITVDYLDASARGRSKDITVWTDVEALTNSGKLNFTATAYAGTPLIGTVVLSGFNAGTGETVGLTSERAALERERIRKADELISARLGVLGSFA